MSELQALFNSWPLVVGIFLFSVILIVGFVAFVHLGSKTRIELMGAYFVGVPIAMVIGVIVGGRDLTRMADSPFEIDLAASASSNWISRGITLICLGIAAERIARFYLKDHYAKIQNKALVWAAVVYCIGSSLLPSILGTSGGFSHQTLYVLPIFIAIFIHAQTKPEQIIRLTRNTILGYLTVSLLWLAINPNLVAETNYRAGLVPGATLRFYGFATHPNTLAPLCLVLMGCLRLLPFNGNTVNLFGSAVAIISLVLTQSKTSLFLVGLILLYFWWLDYRQNLKAQGPTHYYSWVLKLVTLAFLSAACIALVVLIDSFGGGALGDSISEMFDNNQFDTLTGRTQIWTATFKAFSENPLFGYGPGLWGIEFRNKTGLQFTHAHNQYIQTLGASGLFGLITLLAYLGALCVFAWRANANTRGVSWGLFLFIVMRGITEVPLKMDSPFQSEFLTQMFLLTLCVGAFSYIAPNRSQSDREDLINPSVYSKKVQ
jgi:O-antigen ligase